MLAAHFARKISEAVNYNPRTSRAQRHGKPKKKRTEGRDRKEEINESVNTTKCTKFM